MALTINDLVRESHGTAKEKGWHDKPREDGTLFMLMVSEIAEAMEEARNGKPACFINNRPRSVGEESTGWMEISSEHPLAAVEKLLGEGNTAISKYPKPEGVAVELADCVVRIADYFGKQGWNLEEVLRWKMNYNQGREYRHGGKVF